MLLGIEKFIAQKCYEAGKAIGSEIKKEYIKAEIALEKEFIKNVKAPGKLRMREKVKNKFDKEISTITKNTKREINQVVGYIDSSIDGNFCDAIKETINKDNKKWDKFKV